MELSLQSVVALGGLFLSQVGLVLALVAWLKETFSLKGWAVRVVSMLSGAAIGALMFWAFLDTVQEMPLSGKVLTGVLFILGSGLTASGYYDFKNEGK